jgi:hypothetical protein
MKMLTIQPVARPKDFTKVRFGVAAWEDAAKRGAVSVPAITAMEALRNSRGLYEIQPEKMAEVKVNVGGVTLDDMGNPELKLLAARLGVTIKRRNIKRADLIALVKGKLDSVEVLDDEEEEDFTEEPEEDAIAAE